MTIDPETKAWREEYIKREGLDKFIDFDFDYGEEGTFGAVDGERELPFAPDKGDLIRLHGYVRNQKPFTILEFGVGFSTIVMADALRKNKEEYYGVRTGVRVSDEVIPLRVRDPFKVHSVDADLKWVDKFNNECHPILKDFISTTFSKNRITYVDGSVAHEYQNPPDIVPDFIYVDGPHPKDVIGTFSGLSFQCDERTVMDATLLLYESTLLPGCQIVVDGRTNNARFLQRSFKRNWSYNENPDADVSHMKLLEDSLGKYNREGWEHYL